MVHRHAAYLALVSALLAAPAIAQVRTPPIPQESLRGFVHHLQEMAVIVDEKVVVQLAAGAQIRDQQNLIIVPLAIPRSGAWADFTLNAERQIFRVWLLTPAELAQPKKGAGGG